MGNSGNYRGDGDDTVVKGVNATTGDDTRISSVDDAGKERLCVDSQVTSVPGGISTWDGSKLNYEDMNASTGGVARGTTVTNAAWTKVYEYSGSGAVPYWQLSLEDHNRWRIRFVVDGHEIFGSAGISTVDMEDGNIYEMNFDSDDQFAPLFAGINFGIGRSNLVFWGSPHNLPVHFDSTVQVYVRRAAGTSSTRFRAGLMIIHKDT